MRIPYFLVVAALMVTSQTHAFSLSGKHIRIGIATDMTGAQHNPNYTRKTLLTLHSTLKMARAGDTITLIRICDYASTSANMKLSKKLTVTEIKNLSSEAMRPCQRKGSAITKAIQMLSKNNNHINVIFTDGGLSNDKQAAQFTKAVQRLEKSKLTWFAGLSTQRQKNTSIRDALANQLPANTPVLLSGLAETQNGFSQLVKAIKKARK